MYSPMPNGEQHLGGAEREGGSADIDYPDDSDNDSDDSDDREEVESPPRSEHRSKQSQDPAADHGKAAASSVKTQKCTRKTPEPSEKVAKQAKVIPPKPRKALPRIKVVVPVASA